MTNAIPRAVDLRSFGIYPGSWSDYHTTRDWASVAGPKPLQTSGMISPTRHRQVGAAGAERAVASQEPPRRIRIGFVLHVMQVAGAEVLVAETVRRLGGAIDPVIFCLD